LPGKEGFVGQSGKQGLKVCLYNFLLMSSDAIFTYLINLACNTLDRHCQLT